MCRVDVSTISSAESMRGPCSGPSRCRGAADGLDELVRLEVRPEDRLQWRAQIVGNGAPRHGADHPLVVAQQDRAVLKQRAVLPQLGAPDHLSAFDHDLAARRLRETGTGPHTNSPSRWCQLGGNAETAERIPKHPVDFEVALTEVSRAPPGTRRCTSAHGRATRPARR